MTLQSKRATKKAAAATYPNPNSNPNPNPNRKKGKRTTKKSAAAKELQQQSGDKEYVYFTAPVQPAHTQAKAAGYAMGAAGNDDIGVGVPVGAAAPDDGGFSASLAALTAAAVGGSSGGGGVGESGGTAADANAPRARIESLSGFGEEEDVDGAYQHQHHDQQQQGEDEEELVTGFGAEGTDHGEDASGMDGGCEGGEAQAGELAHGMVNSTDGGIINPLNVTVRRRRRSQSNTMQQEESRGFYLEQPKGVADVTKLPPRNLDVARAHRLHGEHVADDPLYMHEKVVRPTRYAEGVHRLGLEQQQHGSSNTTVEYYWQRLLSSRVRWVGAMQQWNTANVLFTIWYSVINIIALVVVEGYSVDLGLGSLAAANTMFLILPATRNNLLTWLLGMPFDHLVLYHRFLGRFTVVVVLVHFLFYWEGVANRLSEREYWTGFAAMLCGLLIVATTFEWVRRKQFNLFYWAHFSFIGFFVFVWCSCWTRTLHSRSAVAIHIVAGVEA
jgi:hypothetical protein